MPRLDQPNPLFERPDREPVCHGFARETLLLRLILDQEQQFVMTYSERVGHGGGQDVPLGRDADRQPELMDSDRKFVNPPVQVPEGVGLERLIGGGKVQYSVEERLE